MIQTSVIQTPAAIGDRIFTEYFRQAHFLLEEGCVPRQIDNALQAWGWTMGPFQALDLAGSDAGRADCPGSTIPDRLRDMGRHGRKTGAGYYLYIQQAPQGLRDPEIEAMIVAHSATIGLARREIFPAEIVERCLLAILNEAAKLLAEGIAVCPADIDAVCIEGYGFPPAKGGPLREADRIGIAAVLERLRFYQAGYQGWAFKPASLLTDLAASGVDCLYDPKSI